MVGRPPILFFTYYRLTPVTQIGVFKRCVRLIQHLHEDFDVHLVNFGPLPERDELFNAVRTHITVHDLASETLGPQLVELMETLRPAVVLGEAPLRGSMRLAHRVATAAGLWQVCIENYYDDFVYDVFVAEWENIDRWLLLGLLAGGQASAQSERIEVTLPLVRFPGEKRLAPRDRVLVIGYDQQTLRLALALLPRLPSELRVDVITAPDCETMLARYEERTGRRLEKHVLPGDEVIAESLSRARFVLGKGGYQQIVESLCLGAPILAQICPGGIEASLIASHLAPYVRLVDGPDDLDQALFDVAGWMLRPSDLPWAAARDAIPDPCAYAASRLRALVEQRDGPTRPEPV